MSAFERSHGGADPEELARLGLAASAVLDLSVNVNPYGPCPAVRAALAEAAVDRYPDPRCTAARHALATALAVDPEQVVLGNGATELLWSLVRALAREPAAVVIAEPAFGELRAAALAHDLRVIGVPGRAEREHAVDFARLADAALETRAPLVYLCNPTTPLGAGLAPADIAALAQALPHAYVVLDESFLSLSDHHADAAVPLPANVVRVRSLTKDHTVPGVRVGYAWVPPELAPRIERARPCWTVSVLAQAVATVALGQSEFLAVSRAQLARDRAALVRGLRELGLAPFASIAPYVSVPVADSAALRARLLSAHRVLVRDCTSFGLPGVVRLAVRPEPERARLLAALREECARC